MSTDTITSTSTNTVASPRSAAGASSYKLRTFVVVFSLTATVVYVLCDLLGFPLFTYHPATGRLEWGYALPRRNEGPVMYWYGWLLTTAIVSTVVALLATFLPENVTRRIPLFALWVLPVLAVPIMFYTLMSFWTK
jgi:hypothetical protein